ncbi:MAG: HEPN domain-containing protein [Candidatus Acidiferrales bacterium]
MPSNAWLAFKRNSTDIERLLEIHADLGGEAQGRRYRLEVLNKSAIVMITAIWEAYCEDLAAEALLHIVDHAPNPDALPANLRKRIAKELKSDLNEVAIWKLADKGWQDVLKRRLADLTEERNKKLNTPKAENIVDLFDTAVGLTDVSTRWHWEKMSVQQAKAKLNKYVSLRGAIAHRGQAATSCKKAQVKDYFAHVVRLVSKTGGTVNVYVRRITGSGLW